jgi:hypothetical protein
MVDDNDWGHVDKTLVKRDLYPPYSKLDITAPVRRNLFVWTETAPYYHDIFTKLVVASFGRARFFDTKLKRSYLFLLGGSYARRTWSRIGDYAGIFYGRMLRDASELRDAIIECEIELEVINERRTRKSRRANKSSEGDEMVSHFSIDTESSDEFEDDEM